MPPPTTARSKRSLTVLPLADHQPYRHAAELVALAQSVLEVAPVAVLARQRAVGEEHEGRRLAAHLGGVVVLPDLAAIGGWVVGGDQLLEDAVDLAGAEAQAV